MEPAASSARTPLHLWVVGLVSLLWNSFGCYDYTMTKLDPAGYFGAVGMSAEAVTYMTTRPAWFSALWALGVWGSLAGSLLLLLRSRHAVAAFAVSLAGLAGSQLYQTLVGVPAEMESPAMWAMTGMIWAILIALLLYARRQAANGVLH